MGAAVDERYSDSAGPTAHRTGGQPPPTHGEGMPTRGRDDYDYISSRSKPIGFLKWGAHRERRRGGGPHASGEVMGENKRVSYLCKWGASLCLRRGQRRQVYASAEARERHDIQ